MSWEDEYRAKHEEEEELTLGYVERLQVKVNELEKELKQQHRKTLIIRWMVSIAAVAFVVWYYSGH